LGKTTAVLADMTTIEDLRTMREVLADADRRRLRFGCDVVDLLGNYADTELAGAPCRTAAVRR
jgi:hypothetical protein